MQSEFQHTSVRIPGVVVCLLALLVIVTELFRTLPGSGWIGDLGSFIESSWAAGVGANPYGTYPLSLRVNFPGYDFWNPNMNPPVSLLFFKLFTFARPATAFRQWYIISGLLYAALLWIMIRRFPDVPRRVVALWGASLGGFWDSQGLGQIYVPVFGLGIIAWLLLEKKRYVAAGIAIGLLVAMKPQFLLWPGLLLLAGHFRPALSALCTFVVLSLLPLSVYGIKVYGQWMDMLASASPSRIPFITNASIPGLFARFSMYYFGLALSIMICILLAVWMVWRRPDVMRVTSLALVAALAVSPLAWMQYTIVLIPLLLSRWHDERVRLVAFSFSVPVSMLLVSLGRASWIQFTVGSIYNWAIVLLLSLLVIEEIERYRIPVESSE